MLLKKLFLFIFLIYFVFKVFGQTNTSRGDIRIMFYNVENLFDTINNDSTNDDEFLPKGDKHWNNYKYWRKINKLYQVIAAAGETEPPEIIGFAEVEDLLPLYHLVNNTPLLKFPYNIIHYDSPDLRGIDVALLVRKDKVDILTSRAIPVIFEDNSRKKTRDILYACLRINTDTLHVFVNHWPSRYRGQSKSEPGRIKAAVTLKAVIDSVFYQNTNAKVIVTGDFNDNPENNSIKIISGNFLINLSEELKKKCDCGSYKYRNIWDMFDQYMVSPSLLNKSSLFTFQNSVSVFDAPFLLVVDTRYGGYKVNRTYLGPKYVGGYSDHLPVILDLYSEK